MTEYLICERCWSVIAIDGKNNTDRFPKVCSHLGTYIDAVSKEDYDRLLRRQGALGSKEREAENG